MNSLFFQYLIRTAVAGGLDPLFSSESSLPNCLEALKRWSTVWRQPDISLCSPSRLLTRQREVNTDSLVQDEYLVGMDFGGRLGYRHAASYEWFRVTDQSGLRVSKYCRFPVAITGISFGMAHLTF